MSWLELERLVADAEHDTALRDLLRGSHNQPELVLNARRLGYHITRVDLARAWQDHQAANGKRA